MSFNYSRDLAGAHQRETDHLQRDGQAEGEQQHRVRRHPPAEPPAGQDQLYLFEEAGWVDAWKALHPANPGYTYEAGNPTIRIDYAWLNPFLANRLETIEIVADRAGADGEHVSDHYGLLVTLDL